MRNYLVNITVKELLNDNNIDYNFKPENVSFLGEVQKSILIELIIINAMPEIEVSFYLSSNGKYIPFKGYEKLHALIDFMDNQYKLFRLETLPELKGKNFNELPYVMRADLEKPIIKCHFYKNLSFEEIKYLNEIN